MNDENLLFGVLALKAGFVTRDQLVDGCLAWSMRRDESLADVLIASGAMTLESRGAVEQLCVNPPVEPPLDEPVLPSSVDEPSVIEVQRATAPYVEPAGSRSFLRMPDAAQRFALLHLHGIGGIGQVWLAREASLERDVALKELRSAWLDDAAARARFIHEAKITGQLEHPGIVPIYELGRRLDGGQPFYTMRFVRGQTLSEAVRDYHARRDVEQAEPVDLLQLLNAFVSVCNTVEYAHSRGVIHRDLKGPNVILGDFGEAILVDWGLAKVVRQAGAGTDAADAGAAAPAPPDSLFDTQPGQLVGTPAYMAPEQASARDHASIDERTDVYGLGTILYEILTGRPPFTGSSVEDVLAQVRETAPVPPRQISAAIPPALEAICLKALAKDRAARHGSARELAEEVQHWLAEYAQTPLKNMAASERTAREALRRAHDQQRALIELIRSEVLQSGDLNETYRRITEVAARTVGVERVSIWRYNRNRSAIACADLYELVAGRHSSGVELEARAFPEYFRALATSEVIAADDAVTDERTREFATGYLGVLGIGSMLDAPIHVGGRLEGVLCQEHVGPPREWTAEERLFAIALSNLVSVAIERSPERREDRARRPARARADDVAANPTRP